MIEGRASFTLFRDDATPRRVREILKALGRVRYRLQAEGTWISSKGDPIWTRNNVDVVEIKHKWFVLDLGDEGLVQALPDKNDGSLKMKVET